MKKVISKKNKIKIKSKRISNEDLSKKMDYQIERMFDIFATKEDLKSFATKEDLKSFATKEDLKNSQNETIAFIEHVEDNILGAFRDDARSKDRKYSDLEVRVKKLENKV